jgi:hypothetical protein
MFVCINWSKTGGHFCQKDVSLRQRTECELDTDTLKS